MHVCAVFSRTNQLLEEFCEATEPTFFYGCLWECVLSCSGARLPAFTFVLEHFNKKQSMDDQLHFMGSSLEVLVSMLRWNSNMMELPMFS